MSVRGIGDLPDIGPAVITLGVFDGVHLGHRAMVDAARAAAAGSDASSVALVFSPHPDEVIRPGVVVPRILPPPVTLDRLEQAGMDAAIELRFDDELREMTAASFLRALGPAIELKGIVMSPESAFGRGRDGTLERVAELGRDLGFETIAVEPAQLDGVPVSSSRVRELLRDGDIAGASRLLAGPPVLRGTVVHGDRRGRELGFPTANLGFDYAPQLPGLGIYLGHVSVPACGVGPRHPALVSIGVRPTFHSDARPLAEVYLLDWDGDLYDAELTVELGERLREERRFETVDALVEQMRADEAEARRRIGLDGG